MLAYTKNQKKHPLTQHTCSMSNNHVFKNTQLDNHQEAALVRKVNTIATVPHLNNDENMASYHTIVNKHHLADHYDLLKNESSLQHHYQIHYTEHEDYDKTRYIQRERISDAECIIEYSKSNDTSTVSDQGIMTALDSEDTGDDCTMEVPLLQGNCITNNAAGNGKQNRDRKHQYELECVCLCQQKGFSFNLNNASTKSAKTKILWAVALCCIFMVVEFLGGYLAGSLAVMTDAAHLASDCISFVISLIAIWLGCKPPDAKMSFGYKRFEVMGAIVSILGIWILTAALVLVALQRIYSNDYDLNANSMMVISGIGILINIVMIFVLHTPMLDFPAGSITSSHGHSHSHMHYGQHGQSHTQSHPLTLSHTHRRCSSDSGQWDTEHAMNALLPADRDVDVAVGAAFDTDEAASIELSTSPMALNGNLLKHQQDGREQNLNLRAATLHVIGDLVQSIGVFLAAVLIKIFPKAAFLDPLCTLLFSFIVIMTTTSLFKHSMHLIMDSVPQGLSLADLERDLLNIDGVKSLHHLNVWNNASNYTILMVHLIIDFLTDSNAVLMKATQLAGSAKYNIKHSTIQVERMTP